MKPLLMHSHQGKPKGKTQDQRWLFSVIYTALASDSTFSLSVHYGFIGVSSICGKKTDRKAESCQALKRHLGGAGSP